MSRAKNNITRSTTTIFVYIPSNFRNIWQLRVTVLSKFKLKRWRESASYSKVVSVWIRRGGLFMDSDIKLWSTINLLTLSLRMPFKKSPPKPNPREEERSTWCHVSYRRRKSFFVLSLPKIESSRGTWSFLATSRLNWTQEFIPMFVNLFLKTNSEILYPLSSAWWVYWRYREDLSVTSHVEVSCG